MDNQHNRGETLTKTIKEKPYNNLNMLLNLLQEDNPGECPNLGTLLNLSSTNKERKPDSILTGDQREENTKDCIVKSKKQKMQEKQIY